jgi:spore coat protein U-like protein
MDAKKLKTTRRLFMKKLMIGLMVVAMVAMAGMAMAATKTNNLSVTASVAASCSIQSVADISFGAYDPTSASNTDAAGNMIFKCVKSTSYKTYITGTRSMSGGGDNLAFTLWTDAGRTATFPSDNSAGGTTAPNGNAITKDIYGRIAALQDVGAASYTATLVATVEY